MYYDPMIAKLVTHAATREAAIDLQADALDAFVIDGVEHNIPFLAALMQHPRWREGRLSTGFIAEEFKGGFKPRAPHGEELHLLAAVAIAIDHLTNARRRQITDQMAGPSVRFASRRIAMVGTERVEALVEGALGRADQGHVRRQGQAPRHPRAAIGLVAGPAGLDRHGARQAGVGAGAADPQRLRAGPPRHPRQGPRLHRARGRACRADAGEGAARHLQAAAVPDAGPGQGDPRGAGQEVKAGEALCVVEAMKMENILRAERDGVVKTVKAKPGDSLAVDAVIMEFA